MARAADLAFSESGPQVTTHHADVEVLPVPTRLVGADLHVLDDVVEPGLVVARALQPSETSPASCIDLGRAWRDVERQPLLHRPREREQPGVLVERAVVGDTPSSRKVRMISCASLTRENGLISVGAVLGEHAEVAARDDTLRPPVSSSRVASAWKMSVGSRR